MANQQLVEYYRSLDSQDALGQLLGKVKEDIHTEFKQKKDNSHGRLEDSDKRQFSRALSGFANSDGGILIFGIRTNRDDVADALAPITDVSAFLGALKKSILNSTIPVVDDVMMDVIASYAGRDVGYVKCLIPASDKTPHRAMLADREYYKRTTEGFYKLEHFDLEDMFGRRPHPSLKMHMWFEPISEACPAPRLHFGFVNVGRGIAKYYGFVCRLNGAVRVKGAVRIRDETATNDNAPVLSYQNDAGVIHANGIVHFAGHALIEQQEYGAPIEFTLTWFCEGMALRSATTALALGNKTTI